MSVVLGSGLTDFLRDAVDLQVQVDAIGLGSIFALMAVGIGLVFGVMRLVNFAYGQLIMAGAFALAFASERDWPVGVGIALCFAVVLALSRSQWSESSSVQLRTQSPAVMLIATFAVAFLLQSIALLWFGPLGKPATSLVELQRPVSVGVSRSARSRSRHRHRCGLPGAAPAPPEPHVYRVAHARGVARLLDRAATRCPCEPRQRGRGADRGRLGRCSRGDADRAVPDRHSDVCVTGDDPRARRSRRGRDDAPVPATLGGFLIGYVSGLLGGALPTNQSQYLPSFLFGLVILVLLVRPDGLFTRSRGLVERVRARRAFLEVLAPTLLVIAAAVLGATFSRTIEIYFINALVNVSIVVAIYVFVGNSGVLSFGHISFVAVGAGRPACSRSPSRRSRRRCPTSSTSCRRPPSETSLRSSSPRPSQACSRFWSGSRSCASRALLQASRRSPCSGSPPTCSGTTRRSGRA